MALGEPVAEVFSLSGIWAPMMGFFVSIAPESLTKRLMMSALTPAFATDRTSKDTLWS
ncbi:hypothetical protein [Marinobacterium weihaiense]|uniref:Uncharacterized protein n=1 Tax=Marinobacterium weihaiense TaxID=2851016 RepID=A0ABS6MGC7_9GAMM|nr:hypothetical protein [Marinobacterium weihaiense]MBV0934772.1 hypothetical protein [Marinobacterium weihaiense]